MRSIRHLIAGAIAVVATAAVVVWSPSAILAGITAELTDFVIDPGKACSPDAPAGAESPSR